MGKRIVLCSDGTGNKGRAGHGTNVWRIYKAVDRHRVNEPQIVFYDDGVGTGRQRSFRTIIGLAFGLGFTRNVRDLYTFLAKTYEPGDEIFLFGFSRGAYTVRAFSGLLYRCGLVDRSKLATERELPDRTRDAVKAYKVRKSHPEITNAFKKKYGVEIENEDGSKTQDVPIKFIGVWDTVSALGLPFDIWLKTLVGKFFAFSFHDNKIAPTAEKGCHALALDEERKTFHPEMWDAEDGKVEQVWFAGVHSNVGGGYPREGMSCVALDWMMEKAVAAGLKFYSQNQDEARNNANVHGRLYDSRARLATYYRYAPRDVAGLCADRGFDTAHIHDSVFERIDRATGKYFPGVLPCDPKVDIRVDSTRKPPSNLKARMAKIDAYQRSARPVLDNATTYVKARKALHGAFVGVSIIYVAAMVFTSIYSDPAEESAVTSKARQGLEVASGLDLADFVVRPVVVLFTEWPLGGVALGAVLLAMLGLRWYLRDRTAAIHDEACGYLRL